ncbi:MAG: class I SAM-dependent RNA methyltransferase [Pseudomonadota bacterium]
MSPSGRPKTEPTPKPSTAPKLAVFLTAPPGLEPLLRAEAEAQGFAPAKAVPGGVEIFGGWPEIWRANLELRGATRVLARIAEFRALHLAQLDKRARRVAWGEVLRPDIAVRIDATCTRSRIYHAGAAAQRVARAVTDVLGASVSPDADLRLLVRIEDDLCTISVDTSGAPLHQRGTKQQVGKAPLRESLAALFLRAAGFDGAEPVVDPMCGSGTFPLEAASLMVGQQPGASRGFAFQDLATYDEKAFAGFQRPATPAGGPCRAWGYDRDQGVIAAATANAQRADLTRITTFHCQPISALRPPTATPGLLITNPPYGARIGNKTALRSLYFSFGDTVLRHFSGWRVAFVTSEPGLARATGLPINETGPPVPHGGLKIRLYQTDPLP